MMRIQIREQLALLIVTSALIGLAVVSLAVWYTNYNLVLSIRSGRLAYTAALKAAQLTSNINVMQTSASFVASRVLIQAALKRYNNGNNTVENWSEASADFEAAISSSRSQGQAVLHQGIVFPRDPNGPGGRYGLLNATDLDTNYHLPLPYTYSNGTRVLLGEPGLGFPPPLYPNLTYSNNKAYVSGEVLDPDSPSVVLGPWWVNSTFALLSITLPIVNNTSDRDVLGYLTVVMDASLITDVVVSRQGLDRTGETLIVTPSNKTNRLPQDYVPNVPSDNQLEVQYIALIMSDADRHPNHVIGTANRPFQAGAYPVIVKAFAENRTGTDNSGSMLATYNENGNQVSTGYASLDTDMVDWVILLEQDTSEVWAPINNLRNILLACVFGTAGFLLVIAFPLAHFAVLPIRRLREATRRSIEPPGASRSSLGSFSDETTTQNDGLADDSFDAVAVARKEGFKDRIKKWKQKRNDAEESRRQARRKRQFRIPGKVKERKIIVKDELSDLTTTFNEMSDELMMQYTRLEERVAQRTAELELSKQAAEVANESKTLFIANISHELKTPLNGILGMCAVCMQEDDPVKLKRELGVIYKSGDLLLNLLNDLLQFTRNQTGQHIVLEEREFRLRDVRSQILAIFDKQAKDGQINLRVEFYAPDGTRADGNGSDTDPEHVVPPTPDGSYLDLGNAKDYILWGDVHRILQVLINLVSNSLKFTPAGGNVTLRVKCLVEKPPILASAHGSIHSRQSRRKPQVRHSSTSTIAGMKRDHSQRSSFREKSTTALGSTERSISPPARGRTLYFQFEVQDTGPGIQPDQQRKIFEPFVQVDLGLSRKYGGTGLGLSICFQLATLMQGKMSVQSTPGVGSTFSMTIPLYHLQTRKDSNASSTVDFDLDRTVHRTTGVGSRDIAPPVTHDEQQVNNVEAAAAAAAATNGTPSKDSQPRLVGLSQPFFATSDPLESPSQAVAMEQIKAEAARGGRIRVLVAEDNKVNQEVVLRMLKLEDIYDVTVASDGQMALDLVKENMAQNKPPFNLIFMDIQMPNVDGIQSTKLIREIGYSAPIVALTAFAEESNIKDCLASGMNYFLSKPIRRPQLKKVLNQYCAPIPEENEDLTPSPSPEETKGKSKAVVDGNTFVIVNTAATSEAANGGITNVPTGGVVNGTSESMKAADEPVKINDETKTQVSVTEKEEKNKD